MTSKWKIISVCSLAITLVGCGRWEREERAVLEREAAGRIVKVLWLHEAQFPDQPRTNLVEIFNQVGTEYPGDLEHKLRKYGDQAGFSNSVFERYVFAPRGISNSIFKGELILLGADPFLDEEAKLVRVVILRNGSGYQGWWADEFPEERIQTNFVNAGAGLTKRSVLPEPARSKNYLPPKYSVADRVRGFFENLAYYYGPGRFFWFPMMLICIGGPLLLGTIFVIYFTRRSRPK